MTDEPMTMTWPSDELGRRLATYAVALSPSTDASARLRAGVMARAAQMLRPIAAPRPQRVASRPTAVEHAGYDWLRRRVAVAAFAMGIGVAGVAGVVAAAQPGGALYETRLWAETLTLPVDSNARIHADVDRLDARLGDARRAALAGNAVATTAALDAYVRVLDDAVAAVGVDPSRDDLVVSALNRHRAVLVGLVTRLPAQAVPALDRAIDRMDAAIEAIEPDGANSHRTGPAGPGGRGAGGTGNGGSGAGGADSSGGAASGRRPSGAPGDYGRRSVRPSDTTTPDPKPAATVTPATAPPEPSRSPSPKASNESRPAARAQLSRRTPSSPAP